MTNEEKREALESLYRAFPEILNPNQVRIALHQSKNTVYEKLKNGEIPYYPVNGRYLIAKADLIEYIIEHDDDNSTGRFKIGGSRGKK